MAIAAEHIYLKNRPCHFALTSHNNATTQKQVAELESPVDPLEDSQASRNLEDGAWRFWLEVDSPVVRSVHLGSARDRVTGTASKTRQSGSRVLGLPGFLNAHKLE